MVNITSFGMGSRNLKNIIGITFIVIIVYVPINTFPMLSVSSKPKPDVQGDNSRGGMVVEVANIVPGDDCNVEVILKLNMRDLMKYLDLDLSAVAKESTPHKPPGNLSFLIQNPHYCDGLPGISYIIYVHTAPKNTDKRDLLRSTWANPKLFKAKNTRAVFLMGRPEDKETQALVEAEHKLHGDIVQGDFIDHYRNLTLKGVLGLKWISEHCPQAKFIIKADDDAFVHIFKLLRLMAKYEHKDKLIACPLWQSNVMPILRDPTNCSKWCVKYNEFPGRNFYPRYCAGLSYVLSRSTAGAMYQSSRTTPFFWIDDVYITGLLPTKVEGLEYLDLQKNFTLKKDVALEQYTKTDKEITLIFIHAYTPEFFKVLWSNTLKRLPASDLALISDEYKKGDETLKKMTKS